MKQFKELKADYDKLIRENAKRINETEELESTGVNFGTPSWKSQVTRKMAAEKNICASYRRTAVGKSRSFRNLVKPGRAGELPGVTKL
jgi:hypothetical protein